MKTGNTAVTEEASAAFEEQPTSNFLPSDKNYRLTGEMPDELESSEREETEVSPDQGGDQSGESEHSDDTETAAASQAASVQKKGAAQTKTASASENRFQKLSRENKELREQIDRDQREREQRERKPAAEATRDTSQNSQAAAAAKPGAEGVEPEPQIDEVDPKTGKPKYPTYGDFVKAQRAWDRKENLRLLREESAKSTREKQLSENEKTIDQEVTKRASAARKAYTDYDAVLKTALEAKDDFGREAFFYPKGSAIDGFFLDCDRSHDVIYQITKNFDQHKTIFARDAQGHYLMNPVRQVRELTKIENSLPAKGHAAAQSSAKPITSAPRPPHQVSGNAGANKDAIDTAVEDGDSESYIQAANAKDPRLKALRARKKA